MFEVLIRNADYLGRVGKAFGCCALGVAAVVRGYDRVNGLGALYALVMCIFFAFSMIAIGVHIINEETPDGGEQ